MGLKQSHGYIHTQDAPSANWDVQHGLNYRPIVSVTITINGQDTIVLPKNIVHNDFNNLTIVFTNPQTGTARCM